MGWSHRHTLIEDIGWGSYCLGFLRRRRDPSRVNRSKINRSKIDFRPIASLFTNDAIGRNVVLTTLTSFSQCAMTDSTEETDERRFASASEHRATLGREAGVVDRLPNIKKIEKINFRPIDFWPINPSPRDHKDFIFIFVKSFFLNFLERVLFYPPSTPFVCSSMDEAGFSLDVKKSNFDWARKIKNKNP